MEDFHFTIYRSKNDRKWYWNFRLSDIIIATGHQSYESVDACRIDIDLLRQNAYEAKVQVIH